MCGLLKHNRKTEHHLSQTVYSSNFFHLQTTPNHTHVRPCFSRGSAGTNPDETTENLQKKIDDPGTQPFDQPESKLLKRLVDDFDPDIFLDAHTGEYAMLFPYARTMGAWPLSSGSPLQEKMMRLGGVINEKFPQLKVPYGIFTQMSGLTVVGRRGRRCI